MPEASEHVLALDGRQVEIDLCEEHARELAGAVALFMEAGRSSRGRSTNGQRRSTGTPDRDQGRGIREWARSRGIKVSDRGRIPANVMREFEASAGR